MGFFQQFKPTQPGFRDPVDPINLTQKIDPTYIPSISITDGFSGIKNNPESGVQVGIEGLDNIKNISNQSQSELQRLIPDLDRVTERDMEFANAYADLLFDKGRRNVEASLSNNISKFREDAFSRGMANSSSFLDGINSLFGSNAGALANLQSDSMIQGMDYALKQAQMRKDAASVLREINSDTFKQMNEVPLNIGREFASKQGDLINENQKINAQKMADYYTILNETISNYNEVLAEKYKNDLEYQDNDFLDNYLITTVKKPKYFLK